MRISEKSSERSVVQNAATLDIVVTLCANEQVLPPGLANSQAVTEPQCIGRAQWVGIESDIAPYAANNFPPIPQRQRHGIFRLARLNPDRRAQFAAAKCQLDNVAVLHACAFCQVRADERGVVPSQARKSARQFLEPAVVRITAVAHADIGTKKNFQLRTPHLSPLPFAKGRGGSRGLRTVKERRWLQFRNHSIT